MATTNCPLAASESFLELNAQRGRPAGRATSPNTRIPAVGGRVVGGRAGQALMMMVVLSRPVALDRYIAVSAAMRRSSPVAVRLPTRQATPMLAVTRRSLLIPLSG